MPRRRTIKQQKFTTTCIVTIGLPVLCGCMNAIGFLTLGVFTSHISGHATNVGKDLVWRYDTTAAMSLSLLTAFFVGGCVSTTLVALGRVRSKARHTLTLIIEAVALAIVAAMPSPPMDPAGKMLVASYLSFVAGCQNALVTRAFGAVLRNSHMTGVATDLAIEVTRLAFWAVARYRHTEDRHLHILHDLIKEDEWAQARTHLWVFWSFVGGAAIGGALYVAAGHRGLLACSAALLAIAWYDWRWAIKRLDL